jgi:hypothetical protein
MQTLTKKLLALTEQSYDTYNAILPEIKAQLQATDVSVEGVRVRTFEQVLEEELPLTTARRAYRTAIKLAMGEPDVVREWRPREK